MELERPGGGALTHENSSLKVTWGVMPPHKRDHAGGVYVPFAKPII